MTPPTDIVIPVHGSREFPVEDLFEKCVESITMYTSAFRFIFVEDYCDSVITERVDSIAARRLDSVIIKTHKQHWFTRAVNLGLRLVKTPHAVLLNCDTVVGDGWLEELYWLKDHVESQYGKVGLVGSEQSAEEPRRYDIVKHPGYVTGHGYLLNMQAMQDVSNFRSTPGWYFDELRADCIHIRSDVFICYDLNNLGWLTVRSFKAQIGHYGGRSWGQQLGRIPGDLSIVNYRY